MMQKFIYLLVASLFLSGCSLSVEKAGVEIMANPEAKVFIDGKEAGMTPYKNNSLKPKEVEIKLVSGKGEWSKKVRLQNRTSTVVHRDFDTETGESGGYVLKIEPTGDKNKSGLLVNCRPDRATIKIDGDARGQSPYKWEDIGVGEKQIDISFPARKKVVVFAKAIQGYQLIIDADLAEEVVNEVVPTPTVGVLSGFLGEIIIKTTETGWLRVRGQPNTISAEIGRVNPGEKYQILDEQDGYYEIELSDEKKGWISTKYADKISEQDQRIEQQSQ